jgi:hypothetical protein
MKIPMPVKWKAKLHDVFDIYLERYPRYLKAKYGDILPRESLAIITIDSLRYDVAVSADTPNIKSMFSACGVKGWQKVGAHGTYTLPSHISMFHAGIMPCDNREEVPGPYNREKERIFKAQLAWERTTGAKFPTPAAPNIVKGFGKMGYRTVGVGGVNWFNNRFITSDFWGKHYFSEFYWDEGFSETDPASFMNQIYKIKSLGLKDRQRPLFFFLNIASTHTPYMGFGRSAEGQRKALEYVDRHIPLLFEDLPDSFVLMLLSDHGECFGEDGLWGHGFYHPRIMEVPFAFARVTRDMIEFARKD